ncbi:family 1 glycosylhydrolase [Candidatus Woesebacteria bacterium]|nr:family 1 glycosylhydrolase [Candidatus Woesebacteria bacterium]
MDEINFHFKSFVMAGFECTYALAENRRRLDLLAATKHDQLVAEDYQLIKDVGIHTVREGLAWHQIDKGEGKYDFSRFIPMIEAAKEQGIQQIWDLNHFDYPADLDPFSQEFVDRFAAYSQAAIKTIRSYTDEEIYVVPLNEISFFSWIGADMGWWAPYSKGRTNGFKFKCQLVTTAIKAMESIWSIDKRVRFIQVDPYMRRVATQPASRAAKRHVKDFNQLVRYEAWDMLSGKTHPELGGKLKYLDIIGVNYYIHNQEWVISPTVRGKRLMHQLIDWESPDRVSFSKMLQDIFERYHRPMLISETGSFSENRVKWWARTLSEIDEAAAMGLPVAGVCAYPVLDRPESAGFLLPNSGLWDFVIDDETCGRVPHHKTLALIQEYMVRKHS